MTKPHRELITLVEQRLDCTLVSWRIGGKHIKAVFEREGKRALVYVSVTPSDRRAAMNVVKDVKRGLFSKGT